MDAKSPEVAPASITSGHLLQLDGLRGVAILLVMVYHFCLPHPGFHGHSSGFLLQWAQGGWMGVDLFFVLSGFLITGILVETREQRHYFRNFLARRFLRIWPLYYLSLLLLVVLVPMAMSTTPPELQSMREEQAWFWLYGANWLFALEGGFSRTSGGYFWSLAVEEQFYLLWPLVVYWLAPARVLRLSAILLFVSLASRWVLIHSGVGSGALYTMTFTHLDGLAVGAFVAIALRSPEAPRLVRYAPAAGVLAAVVLVAIRILDGDLFFWSRNMATYGYTGIAILCGSLLVAVMHARARPRALLNRVFSNGFLRRCGKYSYALYMVHVPVTSMSYPLVARLLREWKPILGEEAVFLASAATAFVLSWALAWLSWHLFEKRVLALKRHFTYLEGPATAEVDHRAAHRLSN